MLHDNTDNKKVIRIIVFMTDNEPLLAGFWFIRTLFIASVLTCFIRYFIAKTFGIDGLNNLVATLCVLLIVLCLFYCFNISTIFIETKEILAMIFITFGSMIRKTGVSGKVNWFAVFTCFIVIYLCFGPVNMFAKTFPKSVELLFTGMAGWILTFQLTRRHNVLMNFLGYCGDNSLQILIWHLLFFKIPTFIYLMLKGDDLRKISMVPCLQQDNWLLIFTYTLVGVLMPLAMKYITDKFRLKINKYDDRK